VKLLLDENLSVRIISRVADLFPDSTHVKAVGLREADGFVVWEWAKKHGFTIVSKDTDFHQRAIVFGHPPNLIPLAADLQAALSELPAPNTDCIFG
jgi:predicted nuclease of predicted toxin-antitoxin system